MTPWVLSAKSDDALAAQADRLREFVIAHPDAEPADVAHALATTRAVLRERAVVVGSDVDDLAAVAGGTTAPGVVTGSARGEGKTVFVFSGAGLAVARDGSGTARLRTGVRAGDGALRRRARRVRRLVTDRRAACRYRAARG